MSKSVIWAENSNFSTADFFPDLLQTGLRSSKILTSTFKNKSSRNVQHCHKASKNFIKRNQRLTISNRPTNGRTEGRTNQPIKRLTESRVREKGKM